MGLFVAGRPTERQANADRQTCKRENRQTKLKISVQLFPSNFRNLTVGPLLGDMLNNHLSKS